MAFADALTIVLFDRRTGALTDWLRGGSSCAPWTTSPDAALPALWDGYSSRRGGLYGIGKSLPDVSDASTDPAVQMLSDSSLKLLRPFQPKLPVHLLRQRDKEFGN